MRSTLLAIVVLASACTAEGPLDAALERWVEAMAGSSAALCRCPEVLGFTTREQCLASPMMSPPDDEQRSCMVELLALDVDTSRTALECMSEAERALGRCLMQSPDCVDMPYAIDRCLGDYERATQSCEAAAPGVEEALLACTAAARSELALGI